jgi:prepilin-type N-terminal cleavage/methylation domain-containing protein
MQTDAPSRERNSGFSLIELLVVVAIGMILAAVGLPGFARAVRSYKIQGAAKQVAGDLQTARSKAVMTNTTNGVSLVIVDSDSYRYVQEDLTKSDDTPRSPLLDLPQGVRFVAQTGAERSPSIRFQHMGGFCNPGAGGVCVGGVKPLCDGSETNPATCACSSDEKTKRCTDSAPQNYFAPDSPATGGVTGGVYAELREETTDLMRRVHIAPGGRIRPGQGQAD